MADTGNSATITFGTTGFTAQYTMIGGAEMERPKVKTSHLTTTNYETYMVGDLTEPGETECEFQYNPNTQPPILNAAETITITYPVPSGLTNGATKSGTGFLVKWSEPELKNNELMIAKYTIAWDGNTEPTYVDAS